MFVYLQKKKPEGEGYGTVSGGIGEDAQGQRLLRFLRLVDIEFVLGNPVGEIVDEDADFVHRAVLVEAFRDGGD